MRVLGILTVYMRNNMSMNYSNSLCARLRGLVISTCKAYLLLSSTIPIKSSSVKMSLKYSIGSWVINGPDGGIPIKEKFPITTCSGSAVSHFSFELLCCPLLLEGK